MLLLLAACTADDSPTAPADDPLPPGLYPLQIASLTIAADGQPGTRLADNGNATSWQPGDQVMVSLGDRQAIYTYNAGTDTWQSDAPLYWQSKAPQTVNAWYPVAGEIDFTQQHIQGLTYLLKADPVSATYGQEEPVNLTFHHQLAKVRVVLEGAKAQEVAAVTVRSYPKSINDKGALGDRTGGDPIYVPMLQTTYEGQPCWEATLRSGTLQADDSFKVAKEGGTPMQVVLDENISIEAGEVYTINIQVNPVVPEDAQDIPANGAISGSGNYVVSGSRGQAITVTGGNPTIYLQNATLSTSGNAIHITSGNPTIHVVGNNNTATSSNGAGIYVAENATVTITGNNRSDVLTVTGNEGSSGIGGYVIDDSNYQSANSGNINIENVTIYAYSSSQSFSETVSPGIGSTGSATCQSIIIDNAIVHAYGCGATSWSAPAIGNGMDWMGNTASSTPTVAISNNSEVHAHRGERNGRSFADYIGRAGIQTYYNDVIATVDATSVVYKYTGYGNTPDQ